MASVIHPTVDWTPAAETVGLGLREDDELLVVCDSESSRRRSNEAGGAIAGMENSTW
ncbi:MAG: hypothetical protein ACOC0Z_04315 [Halohasta sp.]